MNLRWDNYMKRIFSTVVISLIILTIFPSTSTPIIIQKSPNLPSRYIIDKVPQIYQGVGECGPTALAMVLNYYGIKKKKDELKDDLRWDPKWGVSYQKMLHFPFKKYGFKVDFVKEGSIEKVMEHITQDRPVIVRQYENYDAKFKGNEAHWRVVIGYDHEKQRIYMRDPADPKRGSPSLNYKEFLDLWDLCNNPNPSKNLMITLIPEKDILLLIPETILTSETIPFPCTINIIPPNPNLPKEITSFSGIWEGSWGEILPSKLAIEKIDQREAVVVYGFAEDPKGRFLGGWLRATAKVIGMEVIEWGGGDRARFTFTMGKDFKTIEGKREFKADISRVTMTKKE
jgi:uncharacterized protein YvpB